MKLSEPQKQQIIAWLGEGVKLAEIQKRIVAQFGASLTYMEVRFLVDDLKVLPKDVEPPKPVELPKPPAAVPEPEPPIPGAAPAAPAPNQPAAGGKVSVTVDALARANAMVSGSVTFSDGNTADWYLDQMGRLGLAAKVQGYRPPAEDVQTFQMELQKELAKLGF
ncbi:MAG: hypothetical protein HZA89_12775 [Verrucomicrobia bacterium]|nr:hypothetical protein [Verrucomicrobiota bacterium]